MGYIPYYDSIQMNTSTLKTTPSSLKIENCLTDIKLEPKMTDYQHNTDSELEKHLPMIAWSKTDSRGNTSCLGTDLGLKIHRLANGRAIQQEMEAHSLWLLLNPIPLSMRHEMMTNNMQKYTRFVKEGNHFGDWHNVPQQPSPRYAAGPQTTSWRDWILRPTHAMSRKSVPNINDLRWTLIAGAFAAERLQRGCSGILADIDGTGNCAENFALSGCLRHGAASSSDGDCYFSPFLRKLGYRCRLIAQDWEVIRDARKSGRDQDADWLDAKGYKCSYEPGNFDILKDDLYSCLKYNGVKVRSSWTKTQMYEQYNKWVDDLVNTPCSLLLGLDWRLHERLMPFEWDKKVWYGNKACPRSSCPAGEVNPFGRFDGTTFRDEVESLGGEWLRVDNEPLVKDRPDQ